MTQSNNNTPLKSRLNAMHKKSEVLSTLLPRVRPLWWFESYALNMFVEGGDYTDTAQKRFFGTSDVYYEPYEANLGVGFCLDEDKMVEIVRNCDFKEWQESHSQLLEKAKNNIMERKPLLELVHTGVWQSTLNNTCDSSIMLLKDEINKIMLSSQPAVFFLSRNCTLITDANNIEGILFCMHEVICSAEDGNFLTTDTYSLRNNVWVKMGITGDHEIAEKYQALVFEEKKNVFNEFLENLEHLFGNDDLLSSRYDYRKENSGKYSSFAFWTPFPKTLVPKVDRIILGTPESLDLTGDAFDEYLRKSTFDWDVVAAICSEHMHKLTYNHEIWEFRGFPTAKEVKQMQEMQKNTSKLQDMPK